MTSRFIVNPEAKKFVLMYKSVFKNDLDAEVRAIFKEDLVSVWLSNGFSPFAILSLFSEQYVSVLH